MTNHKGKRAGEKSVCTKSVNELKTLLSDPLPDSIQIEYLCDIIERKLHKIDQYTDLIIDSLSEQSAIESEKLNEYEYETNVRYVLTKGRQYLAAIKNLRNPSEGKEVKLPQLVLTKFDDTIVGWSTFGIPLQVR